MGILILTVLVLIVGIGIGFMIGFSRAMRQAPQNLQAPGCSLCIIGRIMVVIGLITFPIAVGLSFHTWYFVRTAQHATGKVIQMKGEKNSASNNDNNGEAPVFQFLDGNGEPHTVASDVYSYPPEFTIGDTVTVLYLKSDPLKAKIDAFFQLWLLPLVFGMITVVDLVVGSSLLLWPKFAGRFKK